MIAFRTKVVWVVLALLLAALGLPLSGHAALTWDVMSIDAKVAADDKKVSHAFTFTNVGAAPVAIERVKSSCGCTSAKLGDKHVYAPGEQVGCSERSDLHHVCRTGVHSTENVLASSWCGALRLPHPTCWATDADQLSDVDNEIRFGGYAFDPVIELYHVRNRVYSPRLGWAQRDPLGYVDGMHLYQYSRFSPAQYVDPSGLYTGLLCSKKNIDKLLGGPWGNDPVFIEQIEACFEHTNKGLLPKLKAAIGGFESFQKSIADAASLTFATKKPIKKEFECCVKSEGEKGKRYKYSAAGMEYLFGFDVSLELKKEYILWGQNNDKPCPDEGLYIDLMAGVKGEANAGAGVGVEVKAGFRIQPNGPVLSIAPIASGSVTALKLSLEIAKEPGQDEIAGKLVHALKLGSAFDLGSMKSYIVKQGEELGCCSK